MMLTTNELFIYESSGYFVLPGVLDRRTIDGLKESINNLKRRYRPEANPDPESRGLRYTFRSIIEEDKKFLEFGTTGLVRDLAVDTCGPNSTLHMSHAMIRPACHTMTTAWHRDGPPLADRDRGLGHPLPIVVTRVGIFLTDLQEKSMGNLMVIPGSHHVSSEPDISAAESAVDLEGSIPICVPAGSIVIFHNAIWHAVMQNRSSRDRLTIYYGFGHPWMAAPFTVN